MRSFTEKHRRVTAVLLTLYVFTLITSVRAQSSTASNFSLPVVGPNGLTGESVSLLSFRGKVVLLEFMEPWCSHCENMAPVVDALYSQYGSGNVVFISIAGPWDGATANDAAHFIKTYGVSWLFLYDSSGSVFNLYGITAVPAYFFIDQRGQIVVSYAGEQTYDTLYAALVSAFPTYTLSFKVSPGSAAGIADLTVDGQTVSSGMQFSWNQGTQHILSVQKTVPGTPGTQYVFTGWSDGVTDVSRTITVTNDAVYTAQYTTQYQLTIASDHGNATGGGWYDEGSKAYAVLNTGTASDGIFYNWDFAGWTNDASGMNLKSDQITMDGPKTTTAKWNHDFTIAFYGIIGTVIAVAAAVGIGTLKRHKEPEPPGISAQTTPLSGEVEVCPECGARVSDNNKFCKECGTKLA